ncbi:MAG: UvrD-helicase domain-containing protein [Clostridia bacterium]|nr:UvrD-helicase domain-containing protein [Clostridia bacterium]
MRQEFLALRKRLLDQEYETLNPPQREAVYTCDCPLLILAGAGSGKTTVLVNKLGYLIKYGNAYHSETVPEDLTQDDMEYLNGALSDPSRREEERFRRLLAVDPLDPYHLLAITFTNKAAGEMRERMEKKFSVDARDLWALTFHSVCVRILRRFADHLGYERDFTIYDDGDSNKLIERILKEMGLTEGYPAKFVRSVINRAKGSYQSCEDYRRTFNDTEHPKLPDLYEKYQSSLRESNAMDFDDLIFNAVKLLTEHSDAAAAVNRRFKYVLVDEYQDTNPLQYRLVTLLAKGGEICVVGDDDQSIYKFAGADIKNILAFEHQFPDARVIRLEQNYRSTNTILTAANEVISHNKNRKGKTLWSNNGQGNKIHYRELNNQHEEGSYVARSVLGRMGADKSLHYRDFCVLYRTHAQSNAIESALRGNGIPYRVYGGLAFYKRKEVQDLLAYLNFIHNPKDRIRLARIINEPKRGIGDTSVERLIAIAQREGISPYEVMQHASRYPELQRAAGRLQEFAVLIGELREAADLMPLPEFFKYLVARIEYKQWLTSSFDLPEAQTRFENVAELLNAITEFAQTAEDGHATLGDYLEQTALVSAVDALNPEDDTVVLMTMHCAKGLEFDTVFITGFEEEIFPSARSVGEDGGLEEERRLCYVAITRAKRELHILSTRSRMIFGRPIECIVSRFLDEIPDDCMEKKIPTPKESCHRPVKSLNDRPFLKNIGIGGTSIGGTGGFGAKGSGRSAAPSPSASKTSYAVGMRIRHKVFGEGTVTAVTPMASDCMLSVSFDAVGEKKLMTNYVKLEIL